MVPYEELAPTPLERIALEKGIEFHEFISAAYPNQAGQAPPGIQEKTIPSKKQQAYRKILPHDEPRIRSLYLPVFMLPATNSRYVIVANPQPYFDAKLTKAKFLYCWTLNKKYWDQEKLAELQAEVEVLRYLADPMTDRRKAVIRYYIAFQFSHLREYLLKWQIRELSGRTLGEYLGMNHSVVSKQKKLVIDNKQIIHLAEKHNQALHDLQAEEFKSQKGRWF